MISLRQFMFYNPNTHPEAVAAPRKGRGRHAHQPPLLDFVEEDENGCWVWQRPPGPGGYGTLTSKGTTRSAHRFFYEAYKGEIGEGLQVDHLCGVPLCVNPLHLEAVTGWVNKARGRHPNWVAHRTGVCAKGHPLERRKDHTGRNYCRTCRNTRRRKQPAELNAAPATHETIGA